MALVFNVSICGSAEEHSTLLGESAFFLEHYISVCAIIFAKGNNYLLFRKVHNRMKPMRPASFMQAFLNNCINWLPKPK